MWRLPLQSSNVRPKLRSEVGVVLPIRKSQLEWRDKLDRPRRLDLGLDQRTQHEVSSVNSRIDFIWYPPSGRISARELIQTCAELWTTRVRNTTASDHTARSHTEHLLSSAERWDVEMWNANSASRISTARLRQRRDRLARKLGSRNSSYSRLRKTGRSFPVYLSAFTYDRYCNSLYLQSCP